MDRIIMRKPKDRREKLRDQYQKEISPIFNKLINCRKCGICCKIYDVELNNNEVTQISNFMGLKKKGFKQRYLKKKRIPPSQAHEYNKRSYYLMTKPCPLLKGNLCEIYKSRPRICRIFPLRFHSFDNCISIEGINRCPEATLLYNKLVEFQDKFEYLLFMDGHTDISRMQIDTELSNSLIIPVHVFFKFYLWLIKRPDIDDDAFSKTLLELADVGSQRESVQL